MAPRVSSEFSSADTKAESVNLCIKINQECGRVWPSGRPVGVCCVFFLQLAPSRFSMLICTTIEPYTEVFVVFLLVAQTNRKRIKIF